MHLCRKNEVQICEKVLNNLVKLDSKLSWTKHITEITSKSSKVLGMVRRTLVPCKPEVKDTAYNMLVRPKPEYASPIWNPHTSSHIIHLERIQHYAARCVANDHIRTTSPTNLVLTLKWQTLERRRIIKQAMTFFKEITEITQPESFQAAISKLPFTTPIHLKCL